jgi:hypothetical protein
MRRTIPLLACLVLVLMPAAAAAKKKHKKPVLRGPVVTVTATGNTTSATRNTSVAIAFCPTGTKVIGGGFLISRGDPFEIAVVSSVRSTPEAWIATAVSSTTNPGAVTAFGYCRRSSRPIFDVAQTGTVPGGLGQTGSASATCPTGTRLVAGGFDSSGAPGAKAAFPQTNMSTAPSTWSVISINNGSPAETIVSHAYCLGGIRAPALVSAQTSAVLAQDQTETVTSPSCPVPKKKKGKKRKPRKLLSAGGFSTPTATGEPIGLVFNSSAGPTGWIATLVNATNTTGSLAMTSQGICV